MINMSNLDMKKIEPIISKQMLELPINECQNYKSSSKFKTHRVMSDIFLTNNQIELDRPYIVHQDYYYLIILLTEGIDPAKITFWHTDSSLVKQAQLKGVNAMHTDFDGISNTYPNNFNEAIQTGNHSFDICNDMTKQLVTHPTKGFDLITLAGPGLANASNTHHKQQIVDRNYMLQAGLKEITYIPLHHHKQLISAGNNGKNQFKTAGVISMRIKGRRGYNGDIKVTDMITGQSYIAPRNSNTFARTKLAWRVGNTQNKLNLSKIKKPKVTQAAPQDYWNDAHKYWKSIIRHYTVGPAGRQPGDGGEQWAMSNCRGIDKGKGLIIQKGKDFYNGGEYDCLTIYHETKLERDSFLSLCKLDTVNKIYNDICFKRGGVSTPSLENFADIPLDRIWTEKDFLNYVKTNY